MTAYHPENLRPSTLRTWSKALAKAAPDVLGHPIALNQAQALIARALGHPHWQGALALLDRDVPAPLTEPAMEVTGPDRVQLIGSLFRSLHLIFTLGKTFDQALDALIQLFLPVRLNALARETWLKPCHPGDPGAVNALASLLGEMDGELASEFTQMCWTTSLRDGLAWAVERLPPITLNVTSMSPPPGTSFQGVASWVRRMVMGLNARVLPPDILLAMQANDSERGWESAQSLRLTTDMLRRLDEGDTFSEGLVALGQEISPWAPWLATGLILVGTFAAAGAGLALGMRALDQQDWLTCPQTD